MNAGNQTSPQDPRLVEVEAAMLEATGMDLWIQGADIHTTYKGQYYYSS